MEIHTEVHDNSLPDKRIEFTPNQAHNKSPIPVFLFSTKHFSERIRIVIIHLEKQMWPKSGKNLIHPETPYVDKKEQNIDTITERCPENTNSHSLWKHDTASFERKFMKSQIHQSRLKKAMSTAALCIPDKNRVISKERREKRLKIQVWSRQQPRESKTQYTSKNTFNQHSHYNTNRVKLRQ